MGVIDSKGTDLNITRQAGLDEIFFQAYEQDKQPGEVRADDTLFFQQGDTQWGFVNGAEYKGPGDYDVVDEDEEVPESTIKIANKYNREVLEFDKDVPIPQRYQEDSEMYQTVNNMVRDMGIRGKTTRDKYAFKYSWGNPFDSTDNPTPDGAAFGSNSHVLLDGSAFDNLETTAMSPDGVSTLVKKLRLQKAHDGDLASYHADGLLCPVILHPEATEITGSELKSQTTDNDLNYFSKVYPGLNVGSSEYLDSDYNSLNSNADTTYAVCSALHGVERKQRISISTDYVGPEFDRKRRAFYRARFRERIILASSGLGAEFTNGTT